MRARQLFHQSQYFFYKIAVISDPRLQQLSALPSFAARIRFCDTNFRKIKAGSGRIAYEYSTELVLKLAKNEKGIQQNITEGDGFIQQNYKELVANVIDEDPNNLWIISEKALKITPTEFKNMIGFSLEELCSYLRHRIEIPRPGPFGINQRELSNKEELFKRLDENNFISELIDLMQNFDMPIGDMCRASSWGKVRNRIVLIDYGITNDILKEYYGR